MSVYRFNPDIPPSGQFLDDSQPVLLTNNKALDNIFGVDHYKYSTGTTDQGKHNQVTTPIISGSAHPTTATDEPKFYAMQESANQPVLQYSRIGSSGVPSPLTSINNVSGGETLAASATTNVINSTGLSFLHFVVYASARNPSSSARYVIQAIGTKIGGQYNVNLIVSNNALGLTRSGDQWQIINNSSISLDEVRFTAQVSRMEV